MEEILCNLHWLPTISLSTSAIIKLEISIMSLSQSINIVISHVTQTCFFWSLYLKQHPTAPISIILSSFILFYLSYFFYYCMKLWLFIYFFIYYFLLQLKINLMSALFVAQSQHLLQWPPHSTPSINTEWVDEWKRKQPSRVGGIGISLPFNRWRNWGLSRLKQIAQGGVQDRAKG